MTLVHITPHRLWIGEAWNTNKNRAVGKEGIYTLRDEQGKITHHFRVTINVAELFYTRLYANDVRPREKYWEYKHNSKVSLVTKEEVGKAMKGTKKRTRCKNNVITMDLLEKKGDILLEKFSNYRNASPFKEWQQHWKTTTLFCEIRDVPRTSTNMPISVL